MESGFSGTDILVCVSRLKLALTFTDKNVCATTEDFV